MTRSRHYALLVDIATTASICTMSIRMIQAVGVVKTRRMEATLGNRIRGIYSDYYCLRLVAWMEGLVTLKEFYDKLEKHDWYYDFSDDGGVYDRGVKAEAELVAIAKESPQHMALYNAFGKHYFSGKAFGDTERAPKPKRPE